MNPLARVRHVLARRPWLYWLAVSALAIACGLVAARAVAAVEDERQAWGSPRTVVVAAHDLAPGDALDGATLKLAVPLPLVPPDALAATPAGAVARQRVAAGEMLVGHDIAATAGPQALIPPGWQAVAVAEPVATGAGVGDRVVAAGGGIVLAPSGVVVAVLAEGVLVAVPSADAPAVAQAATTGELTLLLLG